MKKPTVLALDLGTSQTGYAYRGESTLVEDAGRVSTQIEMFGRLEKLLERFSPEILVIGHPQKGLIHDLSKKVADYFADNYKTFLINEDKTTQQAQFQLLKMHKPKARHQKIHGHAAANILEEYELLYEI